MDMEAGVSICMGIVLVCCVFSGLLISSFVIGGFVMRYLVEEPIQIKEMLNFDYTKNSPVALVPISSCAGLDCDTNCMEKTEVWNNVGSQVIPSDHKLQVTVTLTLPESEYNRHLGIFQTCAYSKNKVSRWICRFCPK